MGRALMRSRYAATLGDAFIQLTCVAKSSHAPKTMSAAVNRSPKAQSVSV